MTEPLSPTITLRPTEPPDQAFLLRLYDYSREAELALVSWDAAQRAAFVSMQAAAQREHYRAEFPAAEELLILLDEQPAGRLYVNRQVAVIHLLDFTLLPEHHASEAGPRILQELMDEAAAAGKAVTIHLQPFDPLQAMFDWLGFKPVGGNFTHLLHEWRAV